MNYSNLRYRKYQYSRQKLMSDMDEMQTIINGINKEGPKFDGKPLYVESLEILENKQHSQSYKNKQSLLQTHNEKLLYHGAPLNNIDNIIVNNFDIKRSFTGMGGHIGRGIYFSDMAEQSIYYCLKDEYIGTETDFIMLVCKVELGRCCELIRNSTSMNCSKRDNYDSHSTTYSQGNKHGHEYCIFDADQIYPMYKLHLRVY